MSAYFVFRHHLMAAATTFVMLGAAGAANAQTAPAPAAGMGGMTAEAALPPLVQVPSVVNPGEQVAPGDVMTFSRQFNAWTMTCARRVSTGRQVCGLNQTVRGEGETGAQVHVGPDVNGVFQMIVSLAGATDKEGGPTLSYGAVEKKFDAGKMRCTALGCAGVVPFDQAMVSALKDVQEIKASFASVKGPKATVAMPLAGFGAAFNAAASDPFGVRVAQAAQEAQQAAQTGMAGMNATPPAPAAKPAEKPAPAKPKAK